VTTDSRLVENREADDKSASVGLRGCAVLQHFHLTCERYQRGDATYAAHVQCMERRLRIWRSDEVCLAGLAMA